MKNAKTNGSLLLPIIFFLLLWTGVLYQQAGAKKSSINVLYPNGGEVLKTGSTTNIRWQSQGVDGKVIIILYKKGIKHSVIAKQTVNSGIFRWKIPRNLPGGKNYRVRIRSLKNLAVNDFSDRNFKVVI